MLEMHAWRRTPIALAHPLLSRPAKRKGSEFRRPADDWLQNARHQLDAPPATLSSCVCLVVYSPQAARLANALAFVGLLGGDVAPQVVGTEPPTEETMAANGAGAQSP